MSRESNLGVLSQLSSMLGPKDAGYLYPIVPGTTRVTLGDASSRSVGWIKTDLYMHLSTRLTLILFKFWKAEGSQH